MCRKLNFLIFFVLALSLAGNIANADISDGLLVWHDFDDLVDDSGNGHDGELFGNATISGGFLELDGTEGTYALFGEDTFGPVNPAEDALNDFTVAIAYASTQTDQIMLLNMGPVAGAEGSGDFSLLGNSPDEGVGSHGVDHWYVGFAGSTNSGINFADGTVHLVIVTYTASTDNYAFYHLVGGAAVAHGGEALDWSGEWNAAMDYVICLGTSANPDADADFGPQGDGDWDYFDGQIDMFAIWNRALDTSEMPEIVEHVPGTPENAGNPNPADGEEDVPLDAVLSWKPGVYADKHDVYFGTNFNGVNEATTTVDPNQVYRGRQDVARYPIFGTLDLDYGQTYYWRIDEVNAPTDPAIYTGNVWSFTAEPFAYGIDGNNINATASSYEQGNEPNNTINGSGLDDDDLHSTVKTDMWLSAIGGPEPTWIQYEFNKVYKLHEMWIWNHNTIFEVLYFGFGFKDVKVEYSSNGIDWMQLDGVPEFEQAPAEDGYAHSNTIDFNDMIVKYVKLTANSNWGNFDQYGLSEVRLLYIPLRAREPNPADEQEGVAPDTVLSWRAGREAATHKVYISTDEQAVTDGTIAPVTTTEATYGPLSIDLDKTYYWKVAEVNNAEDPNVWESDVWSFTTNDFLTVDDMESYGDAAVPGQPGSNIWYTWTDGEGWTGPEPGYGGNGTGSVVEISKDPAFDRQSLTCYYDNDGTNSLGTSGKKYYSEITAAIADLPIGADWTQATAKSLSLQFYGDSDNDAGLTEQMYVKLNGGIPIPYDGDMSDITEEWWHVWLIDLASFGVNLQNITEISIGFGSETNTTAPGGSGVVYIDDIRLYPTRCVAKYGPAGDITGDCLVDNEDFAVLANDWHIPQLAVEYTFDTGLFDTSGNNRHGIDQNSPVVSGGVLTLDGTNFVDIPFGADNPFDGSRDFSIAMDFQTKVSSILISSARDDEPDNHAMSVYMRRWDEPFQSGVIYDNFFVTEAVAEDDPLDGEWHTIIVTYDADGGWDDELEQPTGWTTVYLDGIPGEGVDMDPNIPNIALDTVRIGGSLNTTFPYEQGDDTFVGNLSGSIDNVRIYNFALSQEDIRNYPAVPSGPADLNMDGIVDFKDFAILASTWLEETLWP